MQHSAIYDPRATATPSQADAARQRTARLRRIGSRGRPDTPITLQRGPSLPAVELEGDAEAPEVVNQDLLFALWVDRQREKHAEELKKFEDRAAASEAHYPSVEMIQKLTASHYGVDWKTMFTAARTANVVRPRQVAMYLTKTLTLRSLPDIGRRFGGRDHTTILSGVRKIRRLIETDESLSNIINVLTRRVLNARA